MMLWLEQHYVELLKYEVINLIELKFMRLLISIIGWKCGIVIRSTVS